MSVPHWLFGDQLGPHFLTGRSDTPVVMIEARSVFRRRRFHRAKAHLVLSAMRHRAAELGDRVRHVRADTYREGLREAIGNGPVTVRQPTSYAALRLVKSLDQVRVLPARGFLVTHDDFRAWADGHTGQRLRQEDFYRWVRRSHDLLMDGDQPVGGRWNHDHDNREPPPRGARTLGAPPPYRPEEDEIDDEVRGDLDRWEREGSVAFVGRDGPRMFPASRREALAALRRFVEHRLAGFGPHEDAMLARDPVMSHSLLSSSLDLGLLDPAECVGRAEDAWRAGRAPVNSVEGFVRQVAGWREYVWQLYWHFGEDYRLRNALRHHEPLPEWFLELDADAVGARCLATALAQVRDTGWTHHIPRLMLLGSHALQRGWDPAAVTDWFHRCFVDGYDWVMVPNVVGMSQYADGGRMTTKPYTSGGSYVNRMSDLCGGCVYRPGERTGDRACPYTAGYWAFLHRHRARLERNPRMAQPVRGLDRLADLEELLRQESRRGDGPP
ncbi:MULTISPECIES: cryptochrome/photolyase family protein [Streptomyces]|uniref:Cryptochrome/photolyase family protein n=1 Tax=Streptomyces caniscabiei TaxID=2746961 RepID=A0ABU4N4Z3_9ACTN|nr:MULTISPECIES: cryptochrome/photolyase family protein [Streptomyces]MBE4741180.1 cryptochrome/photolyase family protein [Streptomyces caniscabiei]MBE4760831.1 cryptochrome/photolyase family protein [Streptomyces caniscabiei]MBE4789573.1 cryptochrome/photolyase family protein [Streptomyces caniscabiei]MBE4798758.1 cryptochrome/photolyase family protein [Streptomyces caniscabiei]MDX2947334.1 cryptochrome/photolyase family protein [Streptomyces caniscabiei]